MHVYYTIIRILHFLNNNNNIKELLLAVINACMEWFMFGSHDRMFCCWLNKNKYTKY